MKCPVCGDNNDRVIETRVNKEETIIRRRRECLGCGHRFTTFEELANPELIVIKRNNARVEFDKEKIKRGVRTACRKRPISDEGIDNLVDDILRSLIRDYDNEVPSSAIGERVLSKLKQIDEVAYVRFASVYREFKNIDQFIDVIKKMHDGNRV